MRCIKNSVAACAVLLLASCRLVISTDGGGIISSELGLHDCDQPSCVFDITGPVEETYTAVPNEGYRFVRWRGLCAYSPTNVCDLNLRPLPAQFAEYAQDMRVSAEFEPTTTTRTWFYDADGDHYGDSEQSTRSRSAPAGYVVSNGDCDDSNPDVHPWTRELDDGLDNNCNGKVDEGYVEKPFYLDQDSDGYGDPRFSEMAIRRPLGYVSNNLDCNDAQPDDHPDGTEVLDNRDNDCDGDVDEGGATYYRDVDGDGFGRPYDTIESLSPLEGYADNGEDCDDNNAEISPAAVELFDSIDNDCDGGIDEGFTPST